MKTLKLIAILVLIGIFQSCSSDDNNDPVNNESQIVGTWELVDYYYTGSTTTNAGGISVVTDFVAEAYDIDYDITFSSNPNMVSGSGTMTVKLTSTVQGMETVYDIPNSDLIGTSEWSLEGNVLSMGRDGLSGDALITEITDSTLKFEISTVQDVTQDGVTSTATIDAFYSLVR